MTTYATTTALWNTYKTAQNAYYYQTSGTAGTTTSTTITGGLFGNQWNTATVAVPSYVLAQQQAMMQQLGAMLPGQIVQAPPSPPPPLGLPTSLGTWSPPTDFSRQPQRLKLVAGQPLDIELPDGTVVKLAGSGNYAIEDQDAKVVYRANRMRAFNRYVNASDVLEEFIGFCATFGMSKAEFAELPVKLLIQWLILAAADADGEPVEEERAQLASALTDRVGAAVIEEIPQAA